MSKEMGDCPKTARQRQRQAFVATDGFAKGLSVAPLHVVRWADGITQDGERVRLFWFLAASSGEWECEVWPADTDSLAATGHLSAAVVAGWRRIDSAEVLVTGVVHVEHAPLGYSFEYLVDCQACELADHMKFIAIQRAVRCR